jgi:hypothetical protein
MKKYLAPLLGIILPSIAILLFAILWIYYRKEPNYGGMVILSITFIVLVCYTYVTYLTYLILKEPYSPFGILDLIQLDPRSDDLRVIVRSFSRVPLRAKLKLNPTIYGKTVELPPDFDQYCGARYWELPPVSGINGHIQAITILKAAEKTTEEMEKEYNPEIANKQLRLEAEIKFEDFKKNIFEPKIKHKMVYNFKRKEWIREI